MQDTSYLNYLPFHLTMTHAVLKNCICSTMKDERNSLLLNLLSYYGFHFLQGNIQFHRAKLMTSPPQRKYVIYAPVYVKGLPMLEVPFLRRRKSISLLAAG